MREREKTNQRESFANVCQFVCSLVCPYAYKAINERNESAIEMYAKRSNFVEPHSLASHCRLAHSFSISINVFNSYIAFNSKHIEIYFCSFFFVWFIFSLCRRRRRRRHTWAIEYMGSIVWISLFLVLFPIQWYMKYTRVHRPKTCTLSIDNKRK